MHHTRPATRATASSRTHTLTRALWIIGLCTLGSALGACSTLWPWSHRPAVVPTGVHVLQVESLTQARTIAVPQYWDRNTLRLDLTAAAGTGALRLRPLGGQSWPVRLEFRVQPGSMASLAVRGDARMIFTVPAEGQAVTLRLPAGIYAADTAKLDLRWPAVGLAP